ncbi:hypothetical protein GCM10023197_45860 [Gordonia humi]|uniref:Uncharacterized protein n=1 Tax=Gordonia humi TaxID=686429 RepID=A0A840FFG5_9ACTN|nr:hypothetical protein [Gordonia humi]
MANTITINDDSFKQEVLDYSGAPTRTVIDDTPAWPTPRFLGDETAVTAAAVLQRAASWFVDRA